MFPATFLDRFLAAWPADRWASRNVIVGVSGGADSVALLRVLVAAQGREPGHGRIVAAHFNHRLRGDEADADEAFVRALCEEWEVDLIVGQAEAALDLEKRRRGLEGAARDARYDFFKKTALSEGARYVAVAHSADDQAETILHHILRGTGLAGLRGMPRVRKLTDHVSLVRPLLFFSRQELRDYLAAIGQPFRTDSSNADLDRTRNRIRRELLPLLANDFNPEISAALVRLGQLAGEAYDVVETLAAKLAERAIAEGSRDQVILRVDALRGAAPIVVREALIALWREQGWSRNAMGLAEWESLAAMATETTMDLTRTFPGPIEVRRIGDRLTLTKSQTLTRRVSEES